MFAEFVKVSLSAKAESELKDQRPSGYRFQRCGVTRSRPSLNCGACAFTTASPTAKFHSALQSGLN
jgi:hypothetical protein